ncbi:MAG: hypothetical protein AAGL98_02005, partial [Planctomycetota bacterium]
MESTSTFTKPASTQAHHRVTLPGPPLLPAEVTAGLMCDALDQVGLRNQSPAVPWRCFSGEPRLWGRCRTSEWEDIDYADPEPYEKEIEAIDGCGPGDILILVRRRSPFFHQLLAKLKASGLPVAGVDRANLT